MIWETELNLAEPEKTFSDLVTAWKDDENLVFVVRAQTALDDPRDFYDRNFHLFGTPVALAEDVNAGDRDVQRTGEIWMEVRYDPKHPDAYRHSANAQPLHTDGSYIPSFPNATLMTCVANAGEGGETTFINAAKIVSAMEQEDPDLLESLSSRTLQHARSGDRREECVIDTRADEILVNWNYYCIDNAIDEEGRIIADQFFQYLDKSPLIKENTIAVKLQPGDAITWKDRRVLHGRNGFIANQESERFLWKCAVDVGKIGA
jgi:alpha-ketoglutarate-dependent taurine dioxygenase